MKYEAILKHSSEHSVRKMCKVLGLKEAGYYQWKKRLEKQLEKREREKELVKKVEEIFIINKKVYGYRKMHRALVKSGIAISEYMTRKIMKENGFLPLVVKKYRPSHNGKSSGMYYPDSINQNFTENAPNKVWVGDITYIKTKIGFVYLAVVIDLYNREVVGYAISKTANAELVKLALGNAIARAGGSVEGLIFHSDRGTQYSSKSFRKMLKESGIIGSMSRPACPYDNACSECFFSTAKRECIYRTEYLSIEEVKRDLFEYIELFYNRRRIHATLGYLSPVEFRLSKQAA